AGGTRTTRVRRLHVAHRRVRRGLHRRIAHSGRDHLLAARFQIMITRFRPIAIGVVLIALLMTAAVALQRVRDRAFGIRRVEDSSLYMTSPASVQRLALEYRAMAADLYWIRALQYFGGTRRMVAAGQPIADENQRQYAALYPLLDLTTSLDPRFNLA